MFGLNVLHVSSDFTIIRYYFIGKLNFITLIRTYEVKIQTLEVRVCTRTWIFRVHGFTDSNINSTQTRETESSSVNLHGSGRGEPINVRRTGNGLATGWD